MLREKLLPTYVDVGGLDEYNFATNFILLLDICRMILGGGMC